MNSHRKTFALGAAAILITGAAAVLAGSPSTASGGSGHAERHGWPASSTRSAAAIAHAAHATAARTGARVITVLEVEQRSAFVDVGASGESAGDYFLFESRFLTPDGGATVGRDSVKCTLGVRTVMCEATGVIFHKGKIEVVGTLFSDTDAVLPIVGGTGAFKGAGGTVTIKDLASGDTLLTFEITG